MKKKIGIALLIIGLLFLVNAIWGRYLVLPGYFQSLESGINANTIPDEVPIGKVLRYLLWAFSFKFGIYFSIIGIMLYTNNRIKEITIFTIIGLIYISTAYVDMPINDPLFFGIGGGIVTIDALSIFWGINKKDIENEKHSNKKNQSLLINLGLFFLIMAAYNLCPFCGVKCFALSPEKMIKFNLQETAISFANHIMIELVLGFTLLSIFFNRKKISV